MSDRADDPTLTLLAAILATVPVYDKRSFNLMTQTLDACIGVMKASGHWFPDLFPEEADVD